MLMVVVFFFMILQTVPENRPFLSAFTVPLDSRGGSGGPRGREPKFTVGIEGPCVGIKLLIFRCFYRHNCNLACLCFGCSFSCLFSQFLKRSHFSRLLQCAWIAGGVWAPPWASHRGPVLLSNCLYFVAFKSIIATWHAHVLGVLGHDSSDSS